MGKTGWCTPSVVLVDNEMVCVYEESGVVHGMKRTFIEAFPTIDKFRKKHPGKPHIDRA